MADTDLETVCPTISYGVPGYTCGFSIDDATAVPCATASPHGEVGDDGKEPGNIGVATDELEMTSRSMVLFFWMAAFARFLSATTIVLPIFISAD